MACWVRRARGSSCVAASPAWPAAQDTGHVLVLPTATGRLAATRAGSQSGSSQPSMIFAPAGWKP